MTTTADELRQVIARVDALASAVVLCVGDVMLDHFAHGDVSRISPEAPVPVLNIRRQWSMLGGAGNAVRNVATLGAGVHLVSVIGTDPAGKMVLQLLHDGPPCHAHIEGDDQRPTTVKTRFMAQSQQLMRTDLELAAPIDHAMLSRLVRHFTAVLPMCSAVLLADYAKGVLSGEHAQAFIAPARAAGKPVIVDPKGADFSRYRGATVVKPNLAELREAIGQPVESEQDIVEAARVLLGRCDARYLLVTRGPAGMLVVSADGDTWSLPAIAREVFDVSGAGDTVAAVLACGLGAGLSITNTAQIANVAAGLVVTKAGTATVERGEIVADLRRQSPVGGDHKVVSLDEACELVEMWRRSGLKVGFTNGCFDLLHPGHISLLQQARARCDRLIVGLNSDASVKRLKGPDRPIQDEHARSIVLASLQAVDLVVVFDEATPETLIRALRPDLLVKGADYLPDQVVGADLVRGWGGELFLAEIVSGKSTTNTIAALRGDG